MALTLLATGTPAVGPIGGTAAPGWWGGLKVSTGITRLRFFGSFALAC